MSVMVIWLMRITMDDFYVGVVAALLAVIIILALILWSVTLQWRAERRKRGGYNLEYPADFHVSQADQDQRDRFDQEGIDTHYK